MFYIICDLAQAKKKYFFFGDLFNFLLVLDYHLGEGFNLTLSSIVDLKLWVQFIDLPRSAMRYIL